MEMRSAVGPLLAATLVVSLSANAQAPAARRKVPLREALQLAARQGPDVAAARAQAQIAGAQVRRAWTAWQPDVSATGTFDHTSAPSMIPAGSLGPGSPEIVIVGENSTYATFQISQPLLTPQGLFGPSIAYAGAEAAERGADEAREQVLLGVARTYLGLQGLEGLLDAARDLEKVALRREQDARVQISAGTAVEIALLRAQTETAQARAQIAGLEGQRESLLPLLEALTGENIEPAPSAPSELGAPAQESAEPWEQAYSLRSATAATLAAQRATRLSNFLWLPTVAGVAKENYNSNGGFANKKWTYDLLINVSIPLYDRGARYAQQHEDAAKLAQAQANLASARAKARANWIGARANVTAAQAVLEQSQSQAQLAAKAQTQVESAARAGVATSLDLSDADQKRFAAASAAAQARAALEVRRAEVAAAEGRLYKLAAE
jgi:outer membrane protein TolC